MEMRLGPGDAGRFVPVGGGRLVPFVGGRLSLNCRGRLCEVRELLKDDLRLLKLNSFRTPVARRCGCGCSGEDAVGVAEAGDIGVRKLSARVSRALL